MIDDILLQFRQFANKVLKEYMLKGYAVNQRIDKLGRSVAEHGEKIYFFTLLNGKLIKYISLENEFHRTTNMQQFV